MSVRLIKKSWWVDFRFDHMRNRKRSPENSRAGALAYEATLRQKLARGESIEKNVESQASEMLSYEVFVEQWFHLYVVPNNKFSEQYNKQKIIKANLVPFFGKMSLWSIRTEHIERFKALQKSLGVSNKTINNRLTVLGKSLRCAQDWHAVPMPTIRLLRCPPPETVYLTATECSLLLERAKDQILEMLFLALRTGMRQGEIRGLQWSSIDWQNNTIVVRHSRCDRNRSLVEPKNGRERHIPMDVDISNLLNKRRQNTGYVFVNTARGEPFTSHRLLEDLEKLCERAGIRKVGWHALRHTFATQLAMRAVPLTVVKELLGHSSITMTMRYSHVAPSALREAIESLNPRSQIRAFGQPVGNPELDC